MTTRQWKLRGGLVIENVRRDTYNGMLVELDEDDAKDVIGGVVWVTEVETPLCSRSLRYERLEPISLLEQLALAAEHASQWGARYESSPSTGAAGDGASPGTAGGVGQPTRGLGEGARPGELAEARHHRAPRARRRASRASQ